MKVKALNSINRGLQTHSVTVINLRAIRAAFAFVLIPFSKEALHTYLVFVDFLQKLFDKLNLN
jgi:hypothetical protein